MSVILVWWSIEAGNSVTAGEIWHDLARIIEKISRSQSARTRDMKSPVIGHFGSLMIRDNGIAESGLMTYKIERTLMMSRGAIKSLHTQRRIDMTVRHLSAARGQIAVPAMTLNVFQSTITQANTVVPQVLMAKSQIRMNRGIIRVDGLPDVLIIRTKFHYTRINVASCMRVVPR